MSEKEEDRAAADELAAKVARAVLCPVCDFEMKAEDSRFRCENKKCKVTVVEVAQEE